MFNINVGVPQGSNLGPLLFNLFVNDLLESLTCATLAYADDLKEYAEISCQADADKLQANVDVIADWCERNRLKLNVRKCCVVSYSRLSSPILPAGRCYQDNRPSAILG